jgi:large repetitive protein
VGSNTVTASYPGDANFAGSTAIPLTQVVNKDNSTAGISSPACPNAVFGQPVTVTATVTAAAPGSGTPTSTVQFTIDGSNVGAPVTLDGGGQATFSPTPAQLPIGNHTVGYTYFGDANFIASSAGITQNVTKAKSSAAVVSSANPSVSSQSVTFTATVSAVAPGAGTPTGNVTFLANGNPIGIGMLVNGVATCTTSALPLGTTIISAGYAGDADFNLSVSSQIPQVVNQAATTTSVVGAPNPSTAGQSVTFTSTVVVTPPGTGTPTGTVQFAVDSVNVGAPVTLNGCGQATFTTSGLAAGNRTITAAYSGDTNFNGSTRTFTQTVK